MTDALRSQFVDAARAVHVEVFEEPTAEAVRERVADLIRDQSLLSWASDRLPYGVGDLLGEAHRVPEHADLGARGEATVGLTGCDGAIAQTGALVLGSRPGSPRTASLLPPLHVAVVRPDQLRADLAEVLATDGDALLESCSAINLVAGPSRTADIELVLTLGVHGPGRLIVILGP